MTRLDDDSEFSLPTRSVPVSFELFPPRSDSAALALGRSIDRLAETNPAFFSVTFGAGGSSRDRSLTVLKYILEHTNIEAMAHLTCIGSSHAEANRLVREFLDAGVRSFLALRGDLPPGMETGSEGDLHSAAELVQLIHNVQVERMPFAQVSIPGMNGASRLASGPELDLIAVAAFPSGHPRSRTIDQDIDTLFAKEAAGANLAITQLFWRSEDYLGFVERARSAGVKMPILPGIMPVSNAQRLTRVTELTGVEPPSELVTALQDATNEDEAATIGVEFATKISHEVIEGGAPGLHLYTFNRHEAVIRVVRRLGLATAKPVSERTFAR